jgi:hypothetical protein
MPNSIFVTRIAIQFQEAIFQCRMKVRNTAQLLEGGIKSAAPPPEIHLAPQGALESTAKRHLSPHY